MTVSADEVRALAEALERHAEKIEDLDQASRSTMDRIIAKFRGANGGRKRAENLSKRELSKAGRAAAEARWGKAGERDGGSKKR